MASDKLKENRLYPRPVTLKDITTPKKQLQLNLTYFKKKLNKACLQFIKKRPSDAMSKLRICFVILVDVLLFIASIMIYYIDQMVNGALYYFGLIFDNGWAQPYFLLSRLSVILIIAAILMISSVELPISALKEKE